MAVALDLVAQRDGDRPKAAQPGPVGVARERGVERRGVHGIDATFESLEPVAFLPSPCDYPLVIAQPGPFE